MTFGCCMWITGLSALRKRNIRASNARPLLGGLNGTRAAVLAGNTISGRHGGACTRHHHRIKPCLPGQRSRVSEMDIAQLCFQRGGPLVLRRNIKTAQLEYSASGSGPPGQVVMPVVIANRCWAAV